MCGPVTHQPGGIALAVAIYKKRREKRKKSLLLNTCIITAICLPNGGGAIIVHVGWDTEKRRHMLDTRCGGSFVLAVGANTAATYATLLIIEYMGYYNYSYPSAVSNVTVTRMKL